MVARRSLCRGNSKVSELDFRKIRSLILLSELYLYIFLFATIYALFLWHGDLKLTFINEKSKILKKLESGESDVELTKKYNTGKCIITVIIRG